jgi:(2R)-sulfolactate sulfo-lyase subunit alpha
MEKHMIHFIVHGSKDNVGVAVTDLSESQSLSGWNMETDESPVATASADIPLGHKIALASIAKGREVVKYNVPIGTATANIEPGQHIHTHNLKTSRW